MPAGWKSGVDDATIAANLEAARAAGFAEAHKDAWDRVIKMTRQVVAKLEDTPKTGRKLSVYETLTENARELVNTLESMIGVIDDSNLESALETLKTMIGAASPEVLRDDERQRYTILGAANNILTNGLAALETGPGIPKKTEAPMPAGIPLPEPEPEPADDFSDLLD